MNAVLQSSGHEVRIAQNSQVKRNRRLDAVDDGHLERAAHARDRFLAIAAVRDDLGDHRVVVRGNRAVRVSEGVDADAGTAWDAERLIVPGDGANVSGSSALTRHSIAWPVKVTSPCLNDNRSPAAIRICSLTMSMRR